MIRQIRLENYKCFKNLEMEFSNVNVLTGLNGMGKSSVIQSLLLVEQSKESFNQDIGLSIKGKYIDLGIGQDILYENADKDEIGISIYYEHDFESYTFEYDPESDWLPCISNEREKSGEEKHRIVYLSAYRIEPQQFYSIANDSDIKKHNFSRKGEYAIQYLEQYAGDSIELENIVPYERTVSLHAAVTYWMNLISPGVNPRITVNKKSKVAELKYDFVEGRNRTNPYKSINVGFGITYVLPVVIALISASPGDIILLENPEAHIHPKGQRMLGELISRVGANGVQIILETHSDHVLNGIRVAAKKSVLTPEMTKIYYFFKDFEDDYSHKVTETRLSSDGRLSDWPEGFFDEWDNALIELL